MAVLGNADNGEIITGQVKVAVTGTAVVFGSGKPKNGVLVSAPATNSGPVTIGGASVNNTLAGNGNGFVLDAGDSAPVMVSDLALLYVNGTANDFVSFIGN